MLYFPIDVQKVIDEATKKLGAPKNYRYTTSMSFSQLVEFLTGKGIPFRLEPTTVEAMRVVTRGWWIFNWKEPEIYRAPAIKIELEAGTIRPIDNLNLFYTEEIIDGKLVIAPGKPWADRMDRYGKASVGLDDNVRDFLQGLFPVYQPELPEPLVELPIPKWVYSECDQASGYGGAYPMVLFRSQAEAMAKEFAGQLLDRTGDTKKILEICEHGKSGGDPIGYEQIAEIFAPNK